MKKYLYILLSVLFLSGCGVNKQIDYVRAFEKCKFEVLSADSMFVAGVDVRKVMSSEGLDMSKAPRLALAFLRKDVPLEGRLNLQIKNPSAALAAINQFEYKILIKDKELANGLVNQRVEVQPNGGSTVVPIKINANIYQLLNDSNTQQTISDMLMGPSSGSTNKSILTIKLKPTIGIGNKLIKYPGYITIDKEITKKILM